jgi:hypothetical protein
MQIFGHKWIHSSTFYNIENIEDINNTPSNSIVSLKPLSDSIDIARYCQKNLIPFTIEVNSIKDAIFANLLGAKYIISSKEFAKKIMPIAQNYLFDTQILAQISQEDEIEEMAKAGVDGIIIK